MNSPLDRSHFTAVPDVSPQRDVSNEPAGALPASLQAALLRGSRGRCPRCGSASLFPRFLKPMLRCPGCGQDWSPQRADDFPAYVAILITGHIIVTAAITLEYFADPPTWVQLALWLPLATALLVGLLQPIKGAIIAAQWWYGMHGFEAGSRQKTPARGDPHHNDNE